MATWVSGEKIRQLRHQLVNHGVDENDVAVVVITAADLEEIIDTLESLLAVRELFLEVSRR